MRLRLTLALLFSLSCAASIVTAQGTPKPSLKCNEVIVRDKSHPVWKALDAEFAKFAEAVRKKDLDAMFAPYAPDFQAKEPTGQVLNREQLFSYLKPVRNSKF